ncbi:unnamed protein product [Owenia fusiformis]|uniref:Uncharacterized protein n=1 Tax=Owenia fusiformis TaxID=6347 RepID=A0A8J1Y632_OWEFU|nr:unnamed protein product [Owenia fusiformis]
MGTGERRQRGGRGRRRARAARERQIWRSLHQYYQRRTRRRRIGRQTSMGLSGGSGEKRSTGTCIILFAVPFMIIGGGLTGVGCGDDYRGYPVTALCTVGQILLVISILSMLFGILWWKRLQKRVPGNTTTDRNVVNNNTNDITFTTTAFDVYVTPSLTPQTQTVGIQITQPSELPFNSYRPTGGSSNPIVLPPSYDSVVQPQQFYPLNIQSNISSPIPGNDNTTGRSGIVTQLSGYPYRHRMKIP